MQSYHNQDREIESLIIRPQDDLEEELPLDLNPGLATGISNNDAVPRPKLDSSYTANSPPKLDASGTANSPPKLHSSDTANSNHAAAPLTFASFLQSLGDNALPNSFIPPRPKPPLPESFIIHPERSWRSMSKQEIQAHVVARFEVRRQYTIAYRTWEAEHNKWVFGVWNLVRAIIKSQRRTAPDNPGAVGGDTAVEDTEDAATVLDDAEFDFGSLAATELDSAVLRDQDLDGTALTVLQTNASADQLERAKRWFISQLKRDEQRSPQKPLLPSLQRQGPKGSFGLSAERQSPRPRRTPSVELPESAARKLQSNTTHLAPPETVHDPEEIWRDSSASESEGERDENSCSWRIYSDICACGYAGCHCLTFWRWWDKTLEMLGYVEYVDALVPPPPGALPGTAPGLARLQLKAPPLVESAQPVRSLHERQEDRSKNRGKSYQRYIDYMKDPGSIRLPWLCKRFMVECWRLDVHEGQPESREVMESSNEPSNDEHTLNEHDKSGDLSEAGSLEGDFNLDFSSDGHDQNIPLSLQTVSGHPSSSRYSALKLQWEEFMEDDPKIPTEYREPMLRAIMEELEPPCLPSHIELWKHDPGVRNRLIHWIAFVQYSFCLSPEIFFLAVNLLDRYFSLTNQPPYGTRYDIIAVACLWSAWKFEDSSTAVIPLDTLLMYVEPGTVFRNDVIYAEWTLHQLIQHNMAYVPPILAVRLELKAAKGSKEMAYIARFLIDVSVTAVTLVAGSPSVCGSAAVWLARELMGVQGYTNRIVPGIIRGTEYYFTVAAATYLIRTVLHMPYPLEDFRDHALFYRWTCPAVNNVAGWCQGAFRRVWPGGDVNDFSRELPVLRELIQSKAIPQFQLGPGPSPDHPLFEACTYDTFH